MSFARALTLTLATLLVTPLAAQGHPRGPKPGMGPHAAAPGLMGMRGLNLTEAQKADLKALATKHREAMKPKHEAVQAAHKNLREAMMNPAATVEQLKALHDKASDAQFELALGRRAMMQESLALLTPEQKAKAEQFRAEAQKRREEGAPGRGKGPRPGMRRGPGAPPEGAPADKK